MSAYGPNKFCTRAISIRPIWKRCKNLGYWRQKVVCCQQTIVVQNVMESMIKIPIDNHVSNEIWNIAIISIINVIYFSNVSES